MVHSCPVGTKKSTCPAPGPVPCHKPVSSTLLSKIFQATLVWNIFATIIQRSFMDQQRTSKHLTRSTCQHYVYTKAVTPNGYFQYLTLARYLHSALVCFNSYLFIYSIYVLLTDGLNHSKGRGASCEKKMDSSTASNSGSSKRIPSSWHLALMSS